MAFEMIRPEDRFGVSGRRSSPLCPRLCACLFRNCMGHGRSMHRRVSCLRAQRMMIQNIRMRGCELPGMVAFPSTESQHERFRSQGWTTADAADMLCM